MTAQVTNWDRIIKRAGRNERLFPNRRVYLYGSLVHMTDEWFKLFHEQAKERGLEATSRCGYLYVLLPVGS